MHGQNDLQASQQIIELFELSKSQSEDALEGLPIVYSVVDSNGNILKGNRELAKLFNIDHELLMGRNLNEIIAPQSWGEFALNLKKTSEIDPGPSVQFQIDASSPLGPRNFLWHFSNIGQAFSGSPPPKMIAVLGIDVTEVNRAAKESSRMQSELETARTVQETLFPAPNARFGQSSVSGFYEPASECGGDWWNYSQLGNYLYLWIGDVTGHGVPAALITSAVHAVVSILDENKLSPSQGLKILNKAVCATANKTRTMTFALASVDLSSGECMFASAAHEPVFVIPSGSHEISFQELKILKSRRTHPLGSAIDSEYIETSLNLSRGDRLFFYTDGVYDVNSPTGDAWNRILFRKELCATIRDSRGPQTLVDNLKNRIQNFRQGALLPDDVTFFCFEF